MKIQQAKFILFMMAMSLAVCACSTLTSAERAEREAKTAQAVEKALAERHYRVEVSMVNPRRGRAVNVSSDFSLEVKGDTLVSYLPYFGWAYNVPYGGGKGLNFTAPISEYHTAKGRNGATLITMKAANEEDFYSFRLEVFSNGSTFINLTARERESISYSGQMEVE
jgi:hypothetical protein